MIPRRSPPDPTPDGPGTHGSSASASGSQPPEALAVALRHLAGLIADGLLTQTDNQGARWRQAIQDAVVISGEHPTVLTIADELYRDAPSLTTPEALGRFALADRDLEPDQPGSLLLDGLLVRAQRPRELNPDRATGP